MMIRIHRCAVLAAILLGGCLSRPALTVEHFSIDPSPATRAPSPVFDDVLAIRNVFVAPQFEGRSLVYRLRDSAYETDPYAQWLVTPERMLGGAVRRWLRGTGSFRDVTEPNSDVAASRWGELQITEFYGDFRRPESPEAVLCFRFVLLKAGPTKAGPIESVELAGRTTLAREYTRRVRLPNRTAAGVVQGLQQALNEALAELGSDLTREARR